MEESEKRRERLKAMRAAAAAAGGGGEEEQTLINNNTPLANPLVDTPTQLPPPPPLPRFDFYTDPLSSFSSHKPLRPPSSSSSGPRNSEMSQSGAHQFHNTYAQQQNIHQGGVPYYNPSTTARPMGGRSPYHGHQVRSPCYSPGPATGPMGFRSPFPVHQGSPSFSPSPYNAPQYHNNPSPGLGRGGSAYPEHQGGPNLRPHTQGSGQWPNNSPSPSSGRGRGQSDGSRYSGGRGRGNAYEGHSRSYYDKSMVEDPWAFLEPVIWQSDDDGRFFNSWGSVKMTSSSAKDEPHGNRGSFRRDSSAKKARVSNSCSKTSSEPSLAEFLAAAADEADGDNS
ncbi:protein SICKLE [Silene latifolia]|uniref:protein SICKLE n=1 Tax=Silene latifolia TaxID=37657 RepID=UPI003D773506